MFNVCNVFGLSISDNSDDHKHEPQKVISFLQYGYIVGVFLLPVTNNNI